MIKTKKITIYFLFFILIIFLFGIFSPKNSIDTENKFFLVEKGQNLFEIANNLEDQEIIKNKFFFNFYVLLKMSQNKLKAGEYFLSSSMNIRSVADKIISGDTAKTIITIPEGWNLRDIGWYFENEGMFQAEELFELIGFPLINYSINTDLPKPKDFSSDYIFLNDKPKNISLEGYLFPDTYEIAYDEELEGIVEKMLDNFNKKLSQSLRNEITKQGKTIFEIITMASLIEKEVQSLNDKKIVSGILWKRLSAGMGLQVDATITYITNKKSSKVSKQETEIDSLYNTYKYRGLPLGPISNPGLESIEAAIYPQNSDYWYYLSALDGETIFSKTLEEHNIAKAKYLK
ncbi:MAG: endolytic transglycosylase MltG [Patescibacteria group bacterium]|nr:endolytic transglycosylase MltG [Patescibacteria group bacterium]